MTDIQDAKTTDIKYGKTIDINYGLPDLPPQWSTADTEIKNPFVEKPQLKRSPFMAWSRSEYSHACVTF